MLYLGFAIECIATIVFDQINNSNKIKMIILYPKILIHQIGFRTFLQLYALDLFKGKICTSNKQNKSDF